MMNVHNKKTKIAIVGGDQRSRMLANTLADSGFDTVDIPFTTEDGVIDSDRNVIILPLPVTRDGIHLNCGREGVKMVDIIQRLPPHALVLGGCISERLSDKLQLAGAKAVDYYAREDVLRRNAYLTAEGTLSLIMEHMPRSVRGSRLMVVGCGRCGKELAKLLRRIGAKVTLTSRKKRHIPAILLTGSRPVKTADIASVAPRFDAIINTAPAPVIGREVLCNMNSDAFVIEVATGAAGVDMTAASQLGIKAIYAPGLPGKCVPLSAALVLADAVTKIISEEFA